MIEVWDLESHVVEWRRQRNILHLGDDPTVKRLNRNTDSQGSVFPRHGGQVLGTGSKVDGDFVSVWTSVQCRWVRC